MKGKTAGTIFRTAALAMAISLSAVFGSQGAVVTAGARGWTVQDGGYYYVREDGTRLTGEQVVDHKAYTFDGNGKLVREGIHRDGLEDDLLTQSFVRTWDNWEETLYMVELINTERQKAGLPVLAVDFDLSVAAAYRCAHMVRYHYQAHEYGGVPQWSAVWEAYSRRSMWLRENYYYFGYLKEQNEGVVRDWDRKEFIDGGHEWYCNSPAHYENIMCDWVTKVGVGYAQNENAPLDLTVTLFGKDAV